MLTSTSSGAFRSVVDRSFRIRKVEGSIPSTSTILIVESGLGHFNEAFLMVLAQASSYIYLAQASSYIY